MVFKARTIEGGYLGKHTNLTLIYLLQIVDGPEPNTSIVKWVFEYDESFGNGFASSPIREKNIFGEYLGSHITDVCP
jgi:hypothetical protein